MNRLKALLDLMDAVNITYPPRWREVTDPDEIERIIKLSKIKLNSEY